MGGCDEGWCADVRVKCLGLVVLLESLLLLIWFNVVFTRKWYRRESS